LLKLSTALLLYHQSWSFENTDGTFNISPSYVLEP
jgi:hypothetical protein